jgi:hypothetical protein
MLYQIVTNNRKKNKIPEEMQIRADIYNQIPLLFQDLAYPFLLCKLPAVYITLLFFHISIFQMLVHHPPNDWGIRTQQMV